MKRRSLKEHSYPEGYPTHLECQEEGCDGMMNIQEVDGEEYVVVCDTCERGAHASPVAVDTGSWED